MVKFLTILLFIILHCPIFAQQKPWPTILKAGQKPKVILESSNDSSYIYRSKFFHYTSDSKLEINELSELSNVAHSVHFALKKIPLDLVHPPELAAGALAHSISIYENIDAYDATVGTKFSAGYYSKSAETVFLRKDLFITSKKPNYQLLVHELTHLNMHGIIIHSNAWFSEGNAEYMAAALIGTGSYNFTDPTKNIRTRALSFINPIGEIKESIPIPNLSMLLNLNDQEWMKNNSELEPEQRYHPYVTALITLHYFYHLDPKGREKINQYIKNLTSNDKNLKQSAQQQLFKDIDLTELETKLAKYWAEKGLNITFKN